MSTPVRSALVVGLVTVSLTAIGAVGVAGAGKTRTLMGDLDGVAGAEAKVTVSAVERDGDRYRKFRYRFSPITVYCDGDGQQRIARYPLAGMNEVPIGVRGDDRFGVSVVGLEAGGRVAYRGSIRGRLVTPRHAKGSVRMRGEKLALKGGGHADCDSGKLRFSAFQPKPVEPPSP